MQQRYRFLVIAALPLAVLCLVYLGSVLWTGVSLDAPIDSEASLPGRLATDPARAEPRDPKRDALDTGHQDRDATAPTTFSLRGRCVRASDSLPLAHCTAQTRRELTAQASLDPWPAAAATSQMVTGDDGVFALEVPIDSRRENAALCLSADGFVSRTARWKRPAAGSVIDVGDIAMHRAIRVTGTVTHPDGQPVADARILFANVTLTGQTLLQPESMIRTRTDSAGRFRLPHPAFLGEWYPRVEGSGALVGPQMVVLDKQHHPAYSIHLTVEKPDPKFSITARCVDEAGRPLANVHVTGTGGGFRGQGWSDSEGSVTIPRAGPAVVRGGVALSASDREGRFEQLLPASKTRLQWGDRDVRIVLRRLASHEVRVIDSRGRAIPEFSIFTFRDQGDRLILYHRLSLHGTHANGKVILDRLRNGRNAVIVRPWARGSGSTELIKFVADSSHAGGSLTVTVPDPATLDLKLLDPTGAPVSGSRVELLQSIQGATPTASSKAIDVADCDRESGTPSFLRLADAVTDASGKAELSASPGSWFLRITGKTHIAAVQAVRLEADGRRLQVTVQPGGKLHGTVSPTAALEALRDLSQDKFPVTVELRTSTPGRSTIAEVGRDGAFALGGLPEGKYTASLRFWMRSSSVREGWTSIPITRIELSPGPSQELSIDASKHLPGRISGQIFVGGEPLAGKHCFAKRRPPAPHTMIRFATAADGRFDVRVPPGNYSWSVTLEAQPGPGWIMMTAPGTWQLEPGGTRRVNVEIRLRKVRVRVMSGPDTPLANHPVRVVAADFHDPSSIRTDANGWVTVSPAPPTAFRLAATVDGSKRRTGTIDLPSGRSDGEVVTRLESR